MLLYLGYRSVPLKNAHNEELEMCSLLVYLDMYMVSCDRETGQGGTKCVKQGRGREGGSGQGVYVLLRSHKRPRIGKTTFKLSKVFEYKKRCLKTFEARSCFGCELFC